MQQLPQGRNRKRRDKQPDGPIAGEVFDELNADSEMTSCFLDLRPGERQKQRRPGGTQRHQNLGTSGSSALSRLVNLDQ